MINYFLSKATLAKSNKVKKAWRCQYKQIFTLCRDIEVYICAPKRNYSFYTPFTPEWSIAHLYEKWRVDDWVRLFKCTMTHYLSFSTHWNKFLSEQSQEVCWNLLFCSCTGDTFSSQRRAPPLEHCHQPEKEWLH